MQRTFKLCLVLLALFWTLYSSYGLWLLAHTFPSTAPVKITPTELAASLQAYLVVFGPLVAAILFLFIWRRKSEPKR